jgi:hypothetical protein
MVSRIHLEVYRASPDAGWTSTTGNGSHIAHAAFPQGHRHLRLADELDTLFTDKLFTALFPASGQLALAPWRLALVAILQSSITNDEDPISFPPVGNAADRLSRVRLPEFLLGGLQQLLGRPKHFACSSDASLDMVIGSSTCVSTVASLELRCHQRCHRLLRGRRMGASSMQTGDGTRLWR